MIQPTILKIHFNDTAKSDARFTIYKIFPKTVHE